MPWAVQCSCFRVTTCPLWWLLVALEGRDEPLESVTISQAVAAGHGIVLLFPAWANRKGSGWDGNIPEHRLEQRDVDTKLSLLTLLTQLVKGLQQELNRLYSLFCSRNPEFEEKGGKVSIVSHSLGCVITYDIMTGWNPVRLYEQLLQKEEEEELEERWMSYEEQRLLEELYITKQR